MSTMTVADAIETFGVDIHDHLPRDLDIPVSTRLQFQGDVAIVPAVSAAPATTPVPVDGVPVVRGEVGGNTHLLLPSEGVMFDSRPVGLVLGVLTVAEGATAYLAHPEHGYSGIGPGSYEIRRQREQADEIRMVAD